VQHEGSDSTEFEDVTPSQQYEDAEEDYVLDFTREGEGPRQSDGQQQLYSSLDQQD
jgi:hypothetical protein